MTLSWSDSLSPMFTGASEAIETPSGSTSAAEVTTDTPLAVLFGQRASTVEDPRESLVNRARRRC